jgi:hypothetical protein
MFTVANKAEVRIAQFRTMKQIEDWGKRIHLIFENVTITWRPELINENEWVRSDYR